MESFHSEEKIIEKLRTFIKNNIVAEHVCFDEFTQLSSLGIDSLSLVEILLFIERNYGLIIPESELTPNNLKSISTLSKCVSGLLQPPSQELSQPGGVF